MAKHWAEDQEFLLNPIEEYRSLIAVWSLRPPEKFKLCHNVIPKYPSQQHRSIESINERLPYLDNLLAGI